MCTYIDSNTPNHETDNVKGTFQSFTMKIQEFVRVSVLQLTTSKTENFFSSL